MCNEHLDSQRFGEESCTTGFSVKLTENDRGGNTKSGSESMSEMKITKVAVSNQMYRQIMIASEALYGVKE